MSKYAATLINTAISTILNGVENLRYLEVGTGTHGNTFDKVNCSQKTGVDIVSIEELKRLPDVTTWGKNMQLAKDYRAMSSDAFFTQAIAANEKWDIVFIDADHRCSQVNNDFFNTLRIINGIGIILIHDLFPNSESETSPMDCGDGYRFLYLLRSIKFPLLTVKEDYGLTVIFKKDCALLKPVLFDPIPEVSYREFLDNNFGYSCLSVETLHKKIMEHCLKSYE